MVAQGVHEAHAHYLEQHRVDSRLEEIASCIELIVRQMASNQP